VREAVNSENYSISSGKLASAKASSSKVLGPSLPSSSDMQLAKEYVDEAAARAKQSVRRHERADMRDKIDEMVGPKEVGREGMLEKKRANRDSDQAHRNAKDEAGLEVSDDVLIGGGDSFQAA
jgi:hypothetical protein